MKRSGAEKIFIYLVGVVLGLFILQLMPRKERSNEPHPWHAQTAPEGTYPLTVTDDYGREVELAEQPRWIVSLAPSMTETLFAMDMGDHLSAVTEWDTYPERARTLRDQGFSVGSLDQPDIERIYTLPADVVLGSKLTPRHVYEKIQRERRPKALAFDASSLDDFLGQDLPALGRLLGVPGKALDLVKALRERRAAVAERLAPVRDEPPRRVVLLLGLEDNLAPGWSPGSGTWLDALIAEAHGENAAAALGTQWGQFPLEGLLAAEPDVIFIKDGDTPAEAAVLREQLARLPEHPVWRHLRAVREGRLVILPSGPVNIPGPRMLDLLEALSAGTWPEAVPAGA
ncbi:MAG: ABC transporter substrate-binding protein [Opitutales bacterium]